jgi:hypothetical protein
MSPTVNKTNTNSETKRAGTALSEAKNRTTEVGLRVLARVIVRKALDQRAEQSVADATSGDETENDDKVRR